MFEAFHAKRYAERMTAYLGLGTQSHVIEVASNDGHLLHYFSKRGIPVIGIEPDHASADRAMKVHGIPTLTGSFGRDMARRLAAEGIDADLMVANNALFRVPDVDDFLAGFALLLNAEGVATFEIALTSCLSPRMAKQLFAASGLRIFDVEPLRTHGSLLLFACRADSAWQRGPSVAQFVH
jgi:methyltransferase family protein